MIVLGGSFFIIGIFGRHNQRIESLPNFERWAIKIALSVTVSGSLLNLLLMQPTPWSEIVTNFGFGGIFIWAAYFHFKYFIHKNKNPE